MLTVFSWTRHEGGTCAEVHNFDDELEAQAFMEACQGERFIARNSRERQFGFELLQPVPGEGAT